MKVKVISLPYIFQVLHVLCFTRPRYQVNLGISWSRQHGCDYLEDGTSQSNLYIVDVCDAKPCQNEGTCSIGDFGADGLYSCSCKPGFIGKNCEESKRFIQLFQLYNTNHTI